MDKKAVAGRFFTTEPLGKPVVIIFTFNTFPRLIKLSFLKAGTTCVFAFDF